MKLETESPLYRMRHSAAHVMAAAVCRLFEDVQLDIGPPTDEGFYYDFDLSHRLTPEDFEPADVPPVFLSTRVVGFNCRTAYEEQNDETVSVAVKGRL